MIRSLHQTLRLLLPGTLGVLLAVQTAAAAPLTVRVVDSAGHPIRDAVVTLRPVQGAAPRPVASGSYRISQQNMQFQPFVSVVPVGATVAFPNFDPFRHHVYSFSQARIFELRLFARDQTRSVTFERAGVVAIGCNIHDSMSAFIFVTDTSWTLETTASGAVTFRDVPAAPYVVQVWHPFLRAPGNQTSRQRNQSAAEATETFTVALRAPSRHPMSGY
jgi:plastocyanin